METYADLLRLCQLMHEKNEIQGRRHHARKRALRLQATMHVKTKRRTKKLGWADDIAKGEVHVPDGVSKRMLKMSHSDLHILWYEAHIADNQAKLDLRRFTKANRKEMHTILSRNKWFVDMDNTNGRYVNVVQEGERTSRFDAKYLVQGRDRIQHLAMQAHATMDLETALISA